MAAEPSSFIGRVIDGRYLVESVIGQGGMGVVLRARHKFTSAQVAIKMLNREVRLNQEVQERFLAEARTPSTIGHPGIVQVLDAGSTPEGELYFAMELLTGRTLRQALYPTVPPQVARRISLELLDALGAAHARGIIHRDLKPENVFLANPTGTVKLLDFGIAKAIQTARTHQGQMLGTLAYMSPEQLMDASSVDPRADLWAVGVMLYEMLSGKLPFRATTLVEMVEAFNTRDADPIRMHLPATTPWLDKADAFFARALARDRTQRFRSTQELAGNLAALGLDDALASAGATLAGMVASHDLQMTAADSDPGLPRSAAMPAMMTAARTGSAQPHGTPSTAYTPRGTQQGSGMPSAAAVRAAVSNAPPNDPFPPANPAFMQVSESDRSDRSAPFSPSTATMPASSPNLIATMPAPSTNSPSMVPTMPAAQPLFGTSNRPVAPTIPGAAALGGSPSAPYAVPSDRPSSPNVPVPTMQGAGAPRNRSPSAQATPASGAASGSPSAPFAVPASGSPSAPFAVPATGSPSAPYAVPSDRPSSPNVPMQGVGAPRNRSPSAASGSPSGSPSAPFAVPSDRPSSPNVPVMQGVGAPFALPPSGSPNAPLAVPASGPPPYAVPASPPAAPRAPAPTPSSPSNPGSWAPTSPTSPAKSGSSSLSTWIVLGVVVAAFIGLIIVFMRMNADHDSNVESCVRACKPVQTCGSVKHWASCEAACKDITSKVVDCVQSSGTSCETFRNCVGAP